MRRITTFLFAIAFAGCFPSLTRVQNLDEDAYVILDRHPGGNPHIYLIELKKKGTLHELTLVPGQRAEIHTATGTLAGLTISENVTIAGIQLVKGTVVRFHQGGQIAFLYLIADTDVQGKVFKAKSQLDFLDQGALIKAKLSGPHSFARAEYVQEISFFPNGKIREATSTRAVSIGTRTIPGGNAISRDEKDRITAVMFSTCDERMTFPIDKVPCRCMAQVVFHPSGNLRSCMIMNPYSRSGKNYEAGMWLEFSEDGTVTKAAKDG